MARGKTKNIKGQLFYDFLYLKNESEFDPGEIDRKLKSKALKKYRRKTIRSGKLLEVEIFPIWDTKVLNRGAKDRLSSDKQQRQNEKNRRKHVVRLVHCNFKEGDLWITVGYADGKEPKDDEQAYKNIKNYMDALRRVAKKEGTELKYIYVTERSSKGRYHHHIICNIKDRDLAEKRWKFGKYPQARRITEQDGSLEGLANYITKEVKEKKNQKRYRTSKNLKQPMITIADAAVGKRKAAELAKNENDLIRYAVKEYDGVNFVSSKVLYSEFCDGTYIYMKMIRRE
ncbi:MAG: hypothetical protein Q4A75_09755 [Peptostreptococcaceae bacterium]|nr:hypothetical protein [Peptostreptococcaceae bacterium]